MKKLFLLFTDSMDFIKKYREEEKKSLISFWTTLMAMGSDMSKDISFFSYCLSHPKDSRGPFVIIDLYCLYQKMKWPFFYQDHWFIWYNLFLFVYSFDKKNRLKEIRIQLNDAFPNCMMERVNEVKVDVFPPLYTKFPQNKFLFVPISMIRRMVSDLWQNYTEEVIQAVKKVESYVPVVSVPPTQLIMFQSNAIMQNFFQNPMFQRLRSELYSYTEPTNKKHSAITILGPLFSGIIYDITMVITLKHKDTLKVLRKRRQPSPIRDDPSDGFPLTMDCFPSFNT